MNEHIPSIRYTWLALPSSPPASPIQPFPLWIRNQIHTNIPIFISWWFFAFHFFFCLFLSLSFSFSIFSFISLQNISILVVLLYSWRISVNIKKYGDLEDVYYGKERIEWASTRSDVNSNSKFSVFASQQMRCAMCVQCGVVQLIKLCQQFSTLTAQCTLTHF